METFVIWQAQLLVNFLLLTNSKAALNLTSQLVVELWSAKQLEAIQLVQFYMILHWQSKSCSAEL